jgi:hypothetical protein
VGSFLADCSATLAYDAAKFTGNSILGMIGCDELTPKPMPATRRAANGDTLVLWNWVDNQGGAGVDVLNCQAITRLRGAVEQDVTVAAVCSDREGNRARATYVVAAGAVPPACDGRFGRVTIQLDPRSPLAGDVEFWGPKGSFLLDGSSGDGDATPQALTYADMLPGVHTFAAAAPFGWALGGVSCTPSGKCQVDAAQNSVRITVRACDDVTAVFAVVQRGALRVQTYADANGDGRRQAEERASGPWWHELAAVATDGSTQLVASGFSDGAGEWTVAGLMPGQEHVVCEKPQAGWTNTQPGPLAADARGWTCYRFTLRSGEEAVVTFGQTEGEPQGGGVGIVPRGRAGSAPEGEDAAGVEVRQLPPDSGKYLFLPNVAGGAE